MTKCFSIYSVTKSILYHQDAEIFVTALLKAHEEELDFESKQDLGETSNKQYKGKIS